MERPRKQQPVCNHYLLSFSHHTLIVPVMLFDFVPEDGDSSHTLVYYNIYDFMQALNNPLPPLH